MQSLAEQEEGRCALDRVFTFHRTAPSINHHGVESNRALAPNPDFNSPQAPQILSRFPELPQKVKDNIWGIVVMLNHESSKFSPLIHSSHHHQANIPEQHQAPLLLHTSNEVRAEGLRYYTLCHENQSEDLSLDMLFEPHAIPKKRNMTFVTFDAFIHKQIRGIMVDKKP